MKHAWTKLVAIATVAAIVNIQPLATTATKQRRYMECRGKRPA